MSTSSKPSFSRMRRFGIVLNVFLSIVAVLALLWMANYLAAGYGQRFQVSEHSKWELSPQTVKLLRSVTNDVEVTVFFDRNEEEELYGWVTGLLKEYHNVNPNVKINTIDFTRSPGDAALLIAQHKLTLQQKNFVLFNHQGNTHVVYANNLLDNQIEQVPGEELQFRKRVVGFRGEMLFTSALFSVTHPRALKAYFIWGHGEHDPENTKADEGFGKFASILKEENNIEWKKLTLRGTNEIPADCQLLIVAGPAKAQFAPTELTAIENYLSKGSGRLLVLMNNLAMGGASGIEDVLAKWGVKVGHDIVFDKEFMVAGNDLIAAEVNPSHPVTKPLYAEQLQVYLILPRSLEIAANTSQTADAPKVQMLFRSSTNAIAKVPTRSGISSEVTGSFGLVAAVEQGDIKGVTADRGATRIIVVGDSMCFNNRTIDSVANHQFANLAVNWLLAQPSVLLENLGPKPVKEYSLRLTPPQKRTLRWILMGAMPGSILCLGGLVWLRRRS